MADTSMLDDVTKKAKKYNETVSPEEPKVEEKPTEKEDMLGRALVGLAPILLGGVAGGSQGAAIGAAAGQKGLEDIKEQEKIAREEGKLKAEQENKKLEALGKIKKDKDDRTLAFKKEYNDNPVTKLTQVATSGIEGIRQAVKDPNAYDDVALVYSFMKTLDPGSVVREGEFSVAQKNIPLLETFGIKKEQISSGRYALTPEIRERILSAAEKQYEGKLKAQSEVDKHYSGFAKRFEVNPEDVVSTYSPSQQVGPKVEMARPSKMSNNAMAKEADPNIAKYAKDHGLDYGKAKMILEKRGYGQK